MKVRTSLQGMAVRRTLQGSSAEPNESLGVELPGFRVSSGGAFAHRGGESYHPGFGFPITDQGKLE